MVEQKTPEEIKKAVEEESKAGFVSNPDESELRNNQEKKGQFSVSCGS